MLRSRHESTQAVLFPQRHHPFHAWDVDVYSFARQHGCFFVGFGRFPCAPHCHVAPVETPPALGHHQQVERRAPEAVVRLEIPARIGHEAAYFRGEQHLRQDVGIVVERVTLQAVTHGEGEPPSRPLSEERGGATLGGEADVQINLLVGLVVILYAADRQRGLHLLPFSDKEKAVGPYVALSIEHRHLIHAAGHR